jgi:ATP-dependent protease HslVU (ClpYQ) peptidase subunit
MTILAGTIENGTIYIGADSLWTWDDDFVRESKVSKFIELPRDDILIATAGQDKFTQILEGLIEENNDLATIESRKDVRELASLVFKEVKKFGIGEADNDQLPSHELGFLVASKYVNKIWTIDSDYSVQEFDDYVCIGSGGTIGEAVMRALVKVKIFGKEAIYTAIETASELHPYCGGRIDIRELKLDTSLSEASPKAEI